MDFSLPPEVIELRDRVARFVRDVIMPHEMELDEHGRLPQATVDSLRAKVKASGIWTPHLPVEYGGHGLDMVGMAVVFEQLGKCQIAPYLFNCDAPDEGNMHLLIEYGNPTQIERYLRPLAAGDMRSGFAMTEPAPGAGADPSLLQTRAELHGERWIINGRKWYTTNADGAAFVIVMARTGDDPRSGATLFIVEKDTPGFQVVRQIGVMGSGGPGGHCELTFENVEVSEAQILGTLGQGFQLAQARLGPARLSHCMRWLGMAQRALEIAAERAQNREAFGKRLADHEAIQWMLADSATEIHAGHIMTLHAAWLIDQGQDSRHYTSMAKLYVSEILGKVIDRAIQVCGSLGYSTDLPLERYYRDARAARIADGPSEVHRMVIARHTLKGTREF